MAAYAYLAFEMKNTSSISTFLQSYAPGTWGECTDPSEPEYNYNVIDGMDHNVVGYDVYTWVGSTHSHGGITYALYRVYNMDLDNIDIGSAAGRRGTGSTATYWLESDYTYSGTVSGDSAYNATIVYMGQWSPPTLVSISIYVDNSLISSSTSISVGQTKNIKVVYNLSNGSSSDITSQVNWTHGTSNKVSIT